MLRIWLAFVLAAMMALTGCGVDEGDVADLEGLAGVDRASSSCTLGACYLTVQAVSAITAAQLDEVLREARGIGASRTEITADSAMITFEKTYDGSVDAQASRLVASSRNTTSLSRVQVNLAPDNVNVSGRIMPSGDALWDAARTTWDMLDGVADRTVSVNSGEGDKDRNRITATGAFPQRSVDFVRGLAAADQLSGVDIDGQRVRLGVPALEIVEGVEAEVAADRRAEGLTVEVVLATNILSYREDGGGNQGQVRVMVAALEAVAGADVRVEGSTVQIRAGVDVVDQIAAAMTAVRRDQPAVGTAVPVIVELADRASVELETTGSLDLLTLARLLLDQSEVTELRIRTPDPADDRKSPNDTDGSAQIVIASSDLADAVKTVAARFAQWNTSVASFSVFVKAVDPEGREPSATLRVDRSGSGPWIPSSLERGTPEQIDLGIRAWRSGS